MKATRPLEALNFFIADVQAGIGPFLGVFLQSRGWGADAIGTVMSIGGLAGMLATTPAGADNVRRRLSSIFHRPMSGSVPLPRSSPAASPLPSIQGSSCQSPRDQRC